MIIVVNEVFESSSETDIYALDISKIPTTNKFRKLLTQAKDDIVVSGNDYDDYDDAKDASLFYNKNFPCMVEKLLTVYFE